MNFEEVTLSSDRLVLRRANADLHAEEINSVVCDTIDTLSPWITWANKKPILTDKTHGSLRYCKDMCHFNFRVYLKSEAKMIGMAGAYFVPQEINTYEIGYFIHKNYTQQGYAVEAVGCVIDFAKNMLKACKFQLCCNKNNIGSRKVAEKLGFRLLREEVNTYSSRPDWGECRDCWYQRE